MWQVEPSSSFLLITYMCVQRTLEDRRTIERRENDASEWNSFHSKIAIFQEDNNCAYASDHPSSRLDERSVELHIAQKRTMKVLSNMYGANGNTTHLDSQGKCPFESRWHFPRFFFLPPWKEQPYSKLVWSSIASTTSLTKGSIGYNISRSFTYVW